MNLFFYTTQLKPSNAHLMPWRTILEVARIWQDAGNNVVVFTWSGAGEVGEETDIAGVKVVHVDRPKKGVPLERFCNTLSTHTNSSHSVHSVIYFPIAPGSDYSLMAKRVESVGIEVVWYHPGAWYGKGQVLRALSVMPFRAVLPYIIQAFYPKRGWLKKLGSRSLITMSPYTAKKILGYGYRGRVISIYPGKGEKNIEHRTSAYANTSSTFADTATVDKTADGSNIEHPPSPGELRRTGPTLKDERDSLLGVGRSMLNVERYSPCFLFFGPPNPIRGIFHILEAFKRVLISHPDCRLVCLFRGDANVDREIVKHRIEQLGVGEKLVAVWESVSPEELDVVLSNCYAVLKPFVLVPSEIPLAVIEAAEYGKPVIGFEGDGTGEYIERFGLVATHGSGRDLAQKMMLLLDDNAGYAACCQKALSIYEGHPSWAKVAADWLKLVKQ
jgi:glycosyltransferase involved in cell wall biosynthesis